MCPQANYGSTSGATLRNLVVERRRPAVVLGVVVFMPGGASLADTSSPGHDGGNGLEHAQLSGLSCISMKQCTAGGFFCQSAGSRVVQCLGFE